MAKDIQLRRNMVNYGQIQARWTRILPDRPNRPIVQGFLMTLARDEFQEDYQYYFNKINDEKWYMISTDVGGHILLIRDSDRSLWGMGGNSYGQLGFGDTVSRWTDGPFLIDGTQTYKWIGTGRDMSFAIATNGKMYAAGRNSDYQLGLGYSSAYESTFKQVGTRTDWARVEGGRYHAIALTESQILYVWGNNSLGQLGIGGITTKYSPYNTGRYAQEIAAGEHISMYIDFSGALYGAGGNQFQVLGFASVYPFRVTPFIRIANNGEIWNKVSLGYTHCIALTLDDHLWGWGTNYHGQLAPYPLTGSVAYVSPMQLSTKNWSKISAGYEHSAMIDTDGYLYTCGRGDIIGGQLGLGTINRINAITLVEQAINENGEYAPLVDVSDVSAGHILTTITLGR